MMSSLLACVGAERVAVPTTMLGLFFVLAGVAAWVLSSKVSKAHFKRLRGFAVLCMVLGSITTFAGCSLFLVLSCGP